MIHTFIFIFPKSNTPSICEKERPCNKNKLVRIYKNLTIPSYLPKKNAKPVLFLSCMDHSNTFDKEYEDKKTKNDIILQQHKRWR